MGQDWIEDYDYLTTSRRILRIGGRAVFVAGLFSAIGICVGFKVALDTDVADEHVHLGAGVALMVGFTVLLCLDVLGSLVMEGVAKNLRGMQLLLDRTALQGSGQRNAS